MTTQTAHPERITADDYQDHNRGLFEKRAKALADVDEAKSALERTREGSAPNRAAKRQLRRASKKLDEATNAIVEANTGLVKKYVRKFCASTTKENAEDYRAAGMVGLMVAISTYDPSKGRFASWAYKPVQREVLRCVGSTEFNNLNHGDFEARPAVLRAVKALRKSLELDDTETPGYELVAAESGATLEQVRRVLEAPRLDSLANPIGDDDGMTLADTIDDGGPSVEDTTLARVAVESLSNQGLPQLDPRELYVLVARHGLDGEKPRRLAAIGTQLGLSREAVRQIEAKAIAKLGHPVVLRGLARDGLVPAVSTQA